MKSNWFKNNWLILVTGLVIGIAALVLGAHGNPGNMGFCIACFLRDTAGALGLHGAEVVQYFRPEIVGILLEVQALNERHYVPEPTAYYIADRLKMRVTNIFDCLKFYSELSPETRA